MSAYDWSCIDFQRFQDLVGDIVRELAGTWSTAVAHPGADRGFDARTENSTWLDEPGLDPALRADLGRLPAMVQAKHTTQSPSGYP